MFKQCFIALGFKDAHSSNYGTFQEESCLHQRMLFWKYVRCLGRISRHVFREMMYIQFWKTYFTCLHIPCVIHKNNKYNNYCEKGIACARGFIFDIEVDMSPCPTSIEWSTIWKEPHMLKGPLTSKRCSTPFKGIIYIKCLNMCWLAGLTQQCQYQNQSYKSIGCHWLPMFLHSFWARFQK